MRNIQLKRLELTNYRNIEYAVYEFDGNSRIIGENRIGKTNTLESIYWLLTDKLLDGSSDVAAIKPLKDTKLEVRVKAVFDIDGKQVILEKDYKENWVKTRGSTNLEMKGHTIVWLHNGVKQSTLKAYNQLVAEDFGFSQDDTTKIDFMQMLINPFYLGNIGESKDWTELRSFIIKLVGDVSDEDIVKAKPELARVKKDLDLVGGRVDQLKKKYANDIDSLKTQIVSDEAQIKLLEETPNPTDDELAVAKKGIEEHQDKIAALKSNNGLDVASIDIRTKISEKEVEVAKLEKDDLIKHQNESGRKANQDKIAELRKKQDSLLGEKTNLQINIGNLQWDQRDNERQLKEHQDNRLGLIKQLKEIDLQIANPKLETECPHCHRPYDDGFIETQKELAVANLQVKRENLITEGKSVKQKIVKLEEEINKNEDAIKVAQSNLDALESELSTISVDIDNLNDKIDADTLGIPANPRIATLKDEIAKLEEEYRVSRDNYSKGIQDNQQKIYDEEQAMIPFKKVISDREYYNRQMDNLQFVKSNYKLHSNQLADCEQKKELVNQFIYTKLRMLDENVSKVFGGIKFQLIKENINGGFDAICKPYIFDTLKNESTLTSWKSGSKSERVVTGIAIVEAIKRKLELPNLPYLFDEGGEISSETFATRFKTESQLICVKIADNITSPLVQKL